MRVTFIALIALLSGVVCAAETAQQFSARCFARVARLSPDDFAGYEKYLRDVCHPDYIYVDGKGKRFELEDCIALEKRDMDSGVRYLKTREIAKRWTSHGPDYAVLTATHDFDMLVPKKRGSGAQRVRRRNTVEFTLVQTSRGWRFIQERLLSSSTTPLK